MIYGNAAAEFRFDGGKPSQGFAGFRPHLERVA